MHFHFFFHMIWDLKRGYSTLLASPCGAYMFHPFWSSSTDTTLWPLTLCCTDWYHNREPKHQWQIRCLRPRSHDPLLGGIAMAICVWHATLEVSCSLLIDVWLSDSYYWLTTQDFIGQGGNSLRLSVGTMLFFAVRLDLFASFWKMKVLPTCAPTDTFIYHYYVN